MAYFVKIENNIVVDVRKTTETYFETHPDLYQGVWVRVEYPYPDIGHFYDGENFTYSYHTTDSDN